jgi:hypothetical protein
MAECGMRRAHGTQEGACVRRLLYTMAALLAVAPLAAIAPANAAPAHPATAARVRPLNLNTLECFKITSPDYGSLYWSNTQGAIVSSHSHYTTWCPGWLSNGWETIEFGNAAREMAYHADGNYLTLYSDSGGSPTCNMHYDSNANWVANSYCEWDEFLSSGTWTIESGWEGGYITAVKSGAPVEIDGLGTGEQHWTITCVPPGC